MALSRLYGIMFILSHAVGKTYTTFQVSEVYPLHIYSFLALVGIYIYLFYRIK